VEGECFLWEVCRWDRTICTCRQPRGLGRNFKVAHSALSMSGGGRLVEITRCNGMCVVFGFREGHFLLARVFDTTESVGL